VSKLLTTFAFTAALGTSLAAADPAALDQQNTFVKTHCAVCHTDRANNGGLSLERFDAAVAAPSLAAMMLSKITSGTALATVQAAAHDQAAAAVLDKGLKNGAAGAAGIGVPDKNTVDRLVAAFAAQSSGATKWTVERAKSRSTGGELITASIVRELPSAAAAGRPEIEAAMYRLVLACNATTREGAMQLAWSPLPKRGTLSVAVDGKPPAAYPVEGTERMGNGTAATSGPAAFVIARFGGSGSRIELPKRTLTASQLFPGETVTFPFDQLARSARAALAPCFR
jgi:mono/diheme cytochrome c family protein